MADYIRMLILELNGQKYNKAEHARGLVAKLDNRSRGSVEFKHGNISAVMLELGYPYINGYKPRANYQALLLDVVEAQVPVNQELHQATMAAVLRPAATTAGMASAVNIWVPAPVPGTRETPPHYAPNFSPARVDYLAQEERNRSLGRAGEVFVLEVEARRLHEAGKKNLGDRVQHVAVTQGDGLGYDVLSFENDGRERLIEVKTTAFGQLTPFYVSRNELARSETDSSAYHIYRVFDFRRQPRLFNLQGAITSHCRLDPISYLARLGAP